MFDTYIPNLMMFKTKKAKKLKSIMSKNKKMWEIFVVNYRKLIKDTQFKMGANLSGC